MKRRLLILAALLAPLGLACALCRQAPIPARPAPRAGAEARLRAHVERLASAPRVGANALRAARYLEDELRAMGHAVERQPAPEVPGDNLIVRLGPPGPRLVIGAHYDSHEDTPGADDNASGVAVVLELARALVGVEPRPLELVLYPGEEPPFFRTAAMGSAVHAASVEAADFAGMISVEMVGYFDASAGSQSFPSALLAARYPDTGDFLAVIGRGADGALVDEVARAIAVDERLPIHTAKLPTWVEGVDFSDHLNYWARDLSAVMITDTSFLRNREYHEAGDTPDRLDYPRMSLLVDGLVRLAVKSP